MNTYQPPDSVNLELCLGEGPDRISGLLFTSTVIVKVSIARDYDGWDDCIVNMTKENGKTARLFSWVLIRHTWDCIYIGKMTYNACLEVLLLHYVRWRLLVRGEQKKLRATILPSFIDACMCYVVLQRIDYPNVQKRCDAKGRVKDDGTFVPGGLWRVLANGNCYL